MLLIAIDSDPEGLRKLSQALLEAYPGSQVVAFGNFMLAAQYSLRHPVQAAYAALNGKRFRAAETRFLLHSFRRDIPVFIIGADSRCKKKAKKLGAAGFLYKPVTAESVRNAGWTEAPTPALEPANFE